MHPFQLSYHQLIEYNKLDCKLMMQALMKFFSLMKQISKELGVELTDKDCLNSITLGSFISKILSQMSERLDNNFLNLGKIDE
ncbi:MAG: hypothetical protein KatS3mg003_1073 [Candidatus Nitrosocaldaceae archaeon]|nr:MAG: hypothetical protein KatS3mg003_1073 [Candidatus Nitrosocaldaceae archaeon]